MKELSIEQKAKAHDEAIERAKKLQETCDNTAVVGWCEYILPELKETEDEKIKKEIISFLQLPHPQFVGKRNQEKWIAWLEKQGEKKCIDDLTQQEAMDIAVAKCFEQGGQKPAWSEEDERRLNIICGLLEDIPSHQKWLRTLKDKVQLQSKVTCNEKDKEKLESVINKASYNCGLKNDDISFLKSLKQRIGG